MLNQRLVQDLLDHTHQQIATTISRSLDLFDDEGEMHLFLISLYGRFLANAAQGLFDLGDEAPSGEQLVAVALVMAKTLGDGPTAPVLDAELMQSLTRALFAKYQAIARKLA